MSDSLGAPAGETAPDYELVVNGETFRVAGAWAGESLLYVLRERLDLDGSKNACEEGECGSCAVLLDGMLVCSCCVLALDALGSEITTVEGVAQTTTFGELQRTLEESGGVQCGFCTPGFVVAIHALLTDRRRPSDLELREALSGNLCRCTGYGRILAAVQDLWAQER